MGTHGHRSGNWKSPTYSSWQAMRARCEHPTHPYYEIYGGRGITICPQWTGPGGFAQFLNDLGARPANMTLDRIDPDGNYEPGNCRWATPKQQRANQRREIAAMSTTTRSSTPAPATSSSDIPF